MDCLKVAVEAVAAVLPEVEQSFGKDVPKRNLPKQQRKPARKHAQKQRNAAIADAKSEELQLQLP